MTKIKLNQNGAVDFILLVALVLILGLGFFAFSRINEADKIVSEIDTSAPVVSNASTVEVADYSLYVDWNVLDDSELSYTVHYPNGYNWSLEDINQYTESYGYGLQIEHQLGAFDEDGKSSFVAVGNTINPRGDLNASEMISTLVAEQKKESSLVSSSDMSVDINGSKWHKFVSESDQGLSSTTYISYDVIDNEAATIIVVGDLLGEKEVEEIIGSYKVR